MKQKLSLMVVLLFAAVLQTFAGGGGNNTYYYKSTVSKSGAGVIYATGQNSSATTAPSAPSDDQYTEGPFTLFNGTTTTGSTAEVYKIYVWAKPTAEHTTITWPSGAQVLDANSALINVTGNTSSSTNNQYGITFVTQSDSQKPTIAGADGQTSYWPSIEVTISTQEEGAVIYYTTDGSDPTTSSTRYTGPITIAEANGTVTTVKAIAKVADLNASAVVSAKFTADQPKADTPVISGDAEFWPSTTVTITTAQEGAAIYYTTDGSAPTTASTRYTAPFTVNKTSTVKAIAVVDGLANSVVAEKGFVAIDPSLQPLTVKHMFDDDTYYDGSVHQTAPVFYDVADLAHLKSKTTVFDSYADSRFVGRILPLNTDIQLEFTYDIDKFKSVDADSVPRLNGAVTATGTSNARRLVVKGSGIEERQVRVYVNSPSGAIIKKVTIYGSYFGSSPQTYGLRASDTQVILPEGGVTSNVVYATNSPANRDLVWEGTSTSVGFSRKANSNVYLRGFEVEYVPDLSRATAPTITGDENPFIFERTVTMSSPDEGATIHYTLDGSEPTTSSTTYTKPFTLSETTTVKAISVVDGLTNSNVVTETFTKVTAFENIRAARQSNATSLQFITLNDAVVTWVSAAGDSITVQDNSAEQYSGILLVQPVTAVGQYLSQNDHISGIVYGTLSTARGELSAFRFYNNLPTITAGGDAPFASVSLNDIKAPAGHQSSGGETPYDNMAYLNQMVKYKTTVNSLSTIDWNDDGDNDFKVVNVLTWGDDNVQIFLPPTDEAAISRGEEYTFTGVLTNVLTKNQTSGHTDYGRTRPFRTLRVPSVAYLTDASGRTMSTFEVQRNHYRFIYDADKACEEQITIRSQSRTGTFTYESSNPSVVSVNASTGAITTHAIGEATITVTLTETDDYAAATRTVSITVVGPAYQIPNSDFEAWSNKTGTYSNNQTSGIGAVIGGTQSKSEATPDNFYSWLTGVDSSLGWKYWAMNAGLSRERSGLPEGTAGSSAVKISEGEYSIAATDNSEAYTIKVPGRLTNGAIYVDDFYQYAANQLYGLDEEFNFVYTDYTEDKFTTTLTGLPDAVSLWAKGKSATAPIINVDLHSEGMWIYPHNDNVGGPAYYADAFGAWAGELVAQAYQELPKDEQWHQVTVPFTYAKENERPTMALVMMQTSTSTLNAETGDYLIFDDLKFVYNSELETATFDGVAFEFDENGAATIQGDYDATKLALTSNGRGATIETAYDDATRVLTITVKGDDISVSPDNKHVYTVTFEQAPAMEVEHETTITADGAGTTEVLTEDVTYTAVIANAANGNKNITLKGVEAGVYGIALLEGDLVITNVAVGEDGSLDGSNATFTVVGEESSEVVEGSIVSGTLSSTDMTGVFKVVSVALGIPLELTIYYGVPRDGYTYTRTVTPGRYGTIALPFAVAADGMEGVKAVYSVAGFVAKNGKPNSLVLKEETEMLAGYPYVFLPTASEVTFSAPSTAATSSFPSFYNGFYGSYTRVEMNDEKANYNAAATIYLLSSNKLVKAGSGSYIDGNRGYFLLNDPNASCIPEITETEAAGVKGVRFSFDNTATGISELSIDGDDAVIYNVAGQRLQRTVKGVNIVNGRKVVKK